MPAVRNSPTGPDYLFVEREHKEPEGTYVSPPPPLPAVAYDRDVLPEDGNWSERD
jgi:hypothetical protein